MEKSFNHYLKKEFIKEESEKENLSASHLSKSENNLGFVNFLVKNDKFYEWVIIGCYYTIYHAALALITKKGYSSKNHTATLCSLIKFYYIGFLSREDIELVSKSSIEKEEISYFAYAKNRREKASYGVSEDFTKKEATDLLGDTIKFLNKTREILED